MHKNWWEALMTCFIAYPPWLRPNSIYTRIKLCEEQFLFFIAWPFSWVLYTQHETCIDKDDCWPTTFDSQS